MRWTHIALAGVALLAVTVGAQTTGPNLRQYIFPDGHHDLFYQVESESEAWGVGQGWLHMHWTGDVVVSGESRTTKVQITNVMQGEGETLPPVFTEVTFRARDQGVEAIHSLRVSPYQSPVETDFPEGFWLLSRPLEEGRTWNAKSDNVLTQFRIIATNASSPNPDFEDVSCIHTITTAVERTDDGIALEIEERWFAEGVGPVLFERSEGSVAGLDWDSITEENIEDLLENRDALPDHMTLWLMPFPEEENQ